MKKKFLKISVVCSFVALATIGIQIACNHNNSTFNLAFANIEALASSGEGGASGAHTLDCGSGTIKMCEGTCGRCQVTLKVWGAGSPATLYCPLH